MSVHRLSADSQAILLLCGVFEDGVGVKPLSSAEYSRLAGWLLDHDLRPADLLRQEGLVGLDHYVHDDKNPPDRLQELLKRGGALALAVEQWLSKGLWIVCRSDGDYPQRLKQTLKHLAPPVLYGAGNRALLAAGGLGFVGSRNVDVDGLAFTRAVAATCVRFGLQVVSGAARGVDSAAMQTALDAGGHVIGVLGHGLAQASVSKKYRRFLQAGLLALVSPFNPETGFSVGATMGRNKIIYTLSEACLVVAAESKGGTWTGANENLKHRWVPLLVRQAVGVPEGNRKLIARAATAITLQELAAVEDLQDWLGGLSLPPAAEASVVQARLFE